MICLSVELLAQCAEQGSEQVCACLAHNSSLSSPIGIVYFPQVTAIPALAVLAS